jgi:putative Mg2+ transporter-C (MgtC) family protein
MDATTLSTGELILRVLAAAALGGLVGFEREFSDQPAGFRTHILVSLGSALFTIAGAYGFGAFLDSERDINLDPTRVAAQIVTGIGFLGAGAILRQGLNVRGLTTAAALWVTAAIGMAVGFGYWQAAVATAIVVVAALYGLKRIERVLFARMKKGRFEFALDIGPELRTKDLADIFDAHGARTEKMHFTTTEAGGKRLVGAVWVPPGVSREIIVSDIRDTPGVERVDWSA